jgi:hypothetical protein
MSRLAVLEMTGTDRLIEQSEEGEMRPEGADQKANRLYKIIRAAPALYSPAAKR